MVYVLNEVKIICCVFENEEIILKFSYINGLEFELRSKVAFLLDDLTDWVDNK